MSDALGRARHDEINVHEERVAAGPQSTVRQYVEPMRGEGVTCNLQVSEISGELSGHSEPSGRLCGRVEPQGQQRGLQKNRIGVSNHATLTLPGS